MTDADIIDGHLAYDKRGDGEVVVLVHAGGLDRRMWVAQLDAFPGHRVIAYDARGFVESSTPVRPFRHDQDLIGLLDTLGIARAALVGISMGAQTAVDAALENPRRVKGLVISGGGGGCPDWTDPWIIDINRRLAEAEAAGDPEAWIAGFLDVIPGPTRSLADVPAGIVAAQEAMVRNTLRQNITPPITAGRAPIVPKAARTTRSSRTCR